MSGANLRKGQSPFYGSDTIALVDLNYTLVENSPKWGAPKIYPFIRQIEQETYRQWLVDFLRDKYAVLITARPQKYREATLERIKLLTDWNRKKFISQKFPPLLPRSRKTCCCVMYFRNTAGMERIISG